MTGDQLREFFRLDQATAQRLNKIGWLMILFVDICPIVQIVLNFIIATMTSQERPIEEEKLDEKNEFMRLAEEQLEVVEKEEEKQEVEIDYRLPELVDYFGGK